VKIGFTMTEPTAQETQPVANTNMADVRLAGVAIRAVALIIDSIFAFVVFGLLIALLTDATYSNNSNGSHNAGFKLGTGGTILLALATFAYFVACETVWGATLGKRMVSLRVCAETGERPSFGAAILRNLLRIVDSFPYAIPYLLGAIFIWSAPHKQRVGDRAARTIVIRT